MDKEDSKKLKKSSQRMILWVIISLLALGGATLAWFTFSSYTNVTPIGGAIGSGGVDLLISNYADRDFGEFADLIVEGNENDMRPVSTYDLETWSTSVSNGTNGISNKFKDITEKINECTIYGTLYLKAEGGICDVYFNRDTLSISNDEQLIASSRLGMNFETETDRQQKRIMKLDSLINTGRVSEQNTMRDSNVVIVSVDATGVAETTTDPSEDIGLYSGYSDGTRTYPGEKAICRLNDGEVVCINYRIYMEGCDENCYNEAQEKSMDIKLGFVGVEVKEKTN